MKRILILLSILLSACMPLTAPQPNTLPTAYIDPSYPTVESAPAIISQLTSGIEVRADKAWRDGKQVNANVCFTLLDGSDWSVSGATLQYAGAAMTDFSSTMLSLQEPVEGQSGLRCDTLTFLVPPDADLSNVTIVIDAIATTPREGEYCSVYMPKIQQALQARGIGITLDCADVNGLQTMKIMSMPADMTQTQAEEIVYSDEFYSVKGPWSFSFNLAQ